MWFDGLLIYRGHRSKVLQAPESVGQEDGHRRLDPRHLQRCTGRRGRVSSGNGQEDQPRRVCFGSHGAASRAACRIAPGHSNPGSKWKCGRGGGGGGGNGGCGGGRGRRRGRSPSGGRGGGGRGHRLHTRIRGSPTEESNADAAEQAGSGAYH